MWFLIILVYIVGVGTGQCLEARLYLEKNMPGKTNQSGHRKRKIESQKKRGVYKGKK